MSGAGSGWRGIFPKTVKNTINGLLMIRLVFGQGYGLLVEYAAVTGRSYKLNNGKKHKLRVVVCAAALGEKFQIGVVKMVIFLRHFFFKSTLEYTPRQFFCNKGKECTILIEHI